MSEDNIDNKITINLTSKLKDKVLDLMNMTDSSETDVVFEAIEELHEKKYLPYKKMMELKNKNSQNQIEPPVEDNPFDFERKKVSDEAYLATLEDELREYQNRGDTEMIFLTREKIDRVKDKINGGIYK